MTDTKWIEKNAYDGEPTVGSDEDGEVAYVSVTRRTRTREEALAWLVGHYAAEMGYGRDGRVNAERVESRGLSVDLRTATLSDAVPLRSLVVSGAASAWWRFGVYGIMEYPEDEELREWAERRDLEFAEEQRRRAREWRGPLRWRVRLRLGRRLAGWGARLQPADRVTAQWREGGGWVTVDDLRRPSEDVTA